MSKRDRPGSAATPRWRRLCAALPAFALVGSGIVLTADTPTESVIKAVPSAKASPAVVVPVAPLSIPRSLGAPEREAPGLVLPPGAVAGSSAPVSLDRQGIPGRALEAYRRAVMLIDSADPACHIDWALVAAIGRVESNHARFGGNQLDSGGVAQPGIIGLRLDGSQGTARINDTDGGSLDRDTAYDRAVGPMQFIPSTWRVVGSDADGDGVKNPQDMDDAATATAIYLCSGPGDLSAPDDLRGAIRRYNASDSYVRTVIAIADAYRHGVTELPASDLPAASSASPGAGVAGPSTGPARSAKAPPAKKAPGRSAPAPAPTGGQPAAPGSPVVVAPVPVAPGPVPALPIPALPVPSLPVAPLPLPGVPAPPPQTCTINPLGVKICTIVSPSSTPTGTT